MIKRVLAGALALTMTLGWATPALAWWNDGWAYRKAVTVDTASAKLGEATKRFPLLVRLDSSNFRFEDAKPDGSDLRFVAQDDATPLAYHVESFDPKVGLAMVWVDLPELPANGQAKIWLYYGNKAAQNGGSAPKSFDAGYRAVFHFAGNPADATANAVAAQGQLGFAAGAIGQSAKFAGTPLTIPAAPATAVDPAQGFGFEAWVKPGAAGDAVLYRGDALTIGLAAGVPYVEIAGQRAAATAPLGDWSHVLVSAGANGATLYVNGAQAAQLRAALPAMSGQAMVGEGFAGQIDELRLSTARSAGYAQAAFASQGGGAKLLSFGADEEPSGHGFGYFGVIFKNVTIDAWIVIAILAIMAVISWVVMWAKGSYVGRATRANKLFTAAFAQRRGDVLSAAWQEQLNPAERRLLADSPLARIYSAGVAEFDAARAEDPHGALAEETVEAIRASLDAQQVEETQKLNRWMVLLTIAISGGPFIGLLGTVLGVMITFAAIALAGDVNVNAIAPGVAAALLATVAGLVVAIPALFGYNYIAARNAEVTAGMQVFVDRLITRFADLHRRALHARPAE
jgi:biopolymer transport protein ExbB